MDIDPIELFKDDAENLYERIDNILLKAGDLGHLDKEDITDLVGLYHTLKGNASMIEAYKFIAFVQDIETFLTKLMTCEHYLRDHNLIDLCIDTSYASKDIVILEYEDRLDLFDYIEITNDILKEFNNFEYKKLKK